MKNYRVRLIASAAATATLACPQLSLGETASGSLERAGAIGTPDGSHYSVESLKGSLGDDLLLVGPVESVDLAQQSLSMLGQTVVFAPQDADALGHVQAGSVYAVNGRVLATGRIATRQVLLLSTQFVEGSSEILVTGVVSDARVSIARARIGNLVIDYAGALYAGDPGVAPGVMVQLAGIRVSERDSVLAFDVRKIAQASMGTGFASMGTGHHATAQASMGTGFASMGTGHHATAQASMGTGFASMGTGHEALTSR